MSFTHLSSNAAMYSSGRPSGITIRTTTSEIEYDDDSDASSDDSSPSFGDDDDSGSTTPPTESVPTTPVDSLSSGDDNDDEDKDDKEEEENDHESQDDAFKDQLPTEQDLLELEEALKGYFENEAGRDEDDDVEERSGVVEDFLTPALSHEDESAQQDVVGESDAAAESDEEDWEEVECGGGGGDADRCDDLEVTNQEEPEVDGGGKQAKQETIIQSTVVAAELKNDDRAFVPHNGPHPIEASTCTPAFDATTLTRTTKRKRTRSDDGKLVVDISKKEEEDMKAIPQEKKPKKDRAEPTPKTVPDITKPSRSSRKKRSTASTPQVVSQRRQKELPAGRQLRQEIWGFLSNKETVTKLATQDRAVYEREFTRYLNSKNMVDYSYDFTPLWNGSLGVDPFTGTNTNPGGGSGSSSSSAARARARSRKRSTMNEVIDLTEDDETPSRQHIPPVPVPVTPAPASVTGSPYISSITPEGFYYSAGVGPQYPYPQSLPATLATTTTTRARLPPATTHDPASPYEFSNPQQMGYHHLAEVHSQSQAHATYATQSSHYPPMMGGAPGPYSAGSPPTIPIDNPIRNQYSSGVYASSSFSGSVTPGVQSSSTGQQQFRFIAMDYSHDTGKMNEVGKRNRSRRV